MLNKTSNIHALSSVALLGFSLAAFSSFYPQTTLANPTAPFSDVTSTQAADLLPVQQCEPISPAASSIALPPLSPPTVTNSLGNELAVPETPPPVGLTQPLGAEAIRQASQDTCAGGTFISVPTPQLDPTLLPVSIPQPAPPTFRLSNPSACSGLPGLTFFCLQVDFDQSEHRPNVFKPDPR
ncbi:MAG: hypothetical protein KME07_08670 [Pegethrix bostrychoides GSE-TBD4-15B]|jgi:hypothetical protein|uniref:Uncharacterized protein n=1 Tax=Pegethrix bostrychoides GSE-TBD4-15B TaxID=2839662 RepID=A0A951P9X4_9CYAN|nr:hypothetical protein [Pegethrix bostrychoides GSE-TBD4-15B]